MLVKNVKHYLYHLRNILEWRTNPGTKLPYPVSVHNRDIEKEKVPLDGGLETFDKSEAIKINHARLTHLASLELSLKGKSVLDVGCGVGHLAQFFVEQGCQVVCVDGREQNIISLRSRYPNLPAHIANVEAEPLSRFGVFDVIFCYGLLYHLENPLAGLRNMALACGEMLLLETLISDHTLPMLQLVDESLTSNQALKGLGCRPTPSYVVLALNRVGFPYVYAPKIPPMHPDFQFKWKNNLDAWRDGHPLRCIFVASRTKLPNPNLVNLLED